MTKQFFNFLGSMKLAIYTLLLLGFSSILGTVIQQNQPYNSYISKFGNFWFDIFLKLEIFNVFNSVWFLSIILFLIITISTCIYRNYSSVIKKIKSGDLKVRKSALKQFEFKEEWTENESTVDSDKIIKLLKDFKFNTKIFTSDNSTYITAVKGKFQKLGYFFTHFSMLIIFIASFIDSNITIFVKDFFGQVLPQTESISIKNIPESSKINSNNFSFRGNVNLPEKKKTSVAFLPYREGYLVQELPFQLELLDFRIEHYKTGQPKSFESDVLLTSKDFDEPIKQTISVNNPLIYKDFAFYQSSFSDGGSKLTLSLKKLSDSKASIKVNSAIFDTFEIQDKLETFSIELEDLREFNIVPNETNEKKFKNIGPSIIFKMRDSKGNANEFINYQNPVLINDRLYFLSGVKKSIGENYAFLKIPVDKKFSTKRFFEWTNILADENLIYFYVSKIENDNKLTNTNKINDNQIKGYSKLVSLFFNGGYKEIRKFFDYSLKNNILIDRENYLSSLNFLLFSIYKQLLEKEYGKKIEEVSEFDKNYFEDLVSATDALNYYESNFLLQIDSFEKLYSSGIQITKSPGKPFVYLGSILLLVGIYFMFYMRFFNIYIYIENKNLSSYFLVSGKSEKNKSEFKSIFDKFIYSLKNN